MRNPKEKKRGAQLYGALVALIVLASAAISPGLSAQSETSEAAALEVAQAFMGALGGGDIETLERLMADDMVWHNEGDAEIPWIGPWDGKRAILDTFLPAYGAGAQTLMWEVDHASGDDHVATLTGRMSLLLKASGVETGPTSWAVKVAVRDGQVVHWHWYEDSLLISRAFHGSAPPPPRTRQGGP
ncbi:MAG: nuclear transport factor 2 family protein, partial [Acidobacteriota bacterium]